MSEDGKAELRKRWREVVDHVQVYAIARVSELGLPDTGVTTVMHSGFEGGEPVVAVATSLPTRAAMRGVLAFALAQSLEADGVATADMSEAATGDLDAFMSRRAGDHDSGWYRHDGAMRRQLGELELFANQFGDWVVIAADGMVAKGEAGNTLHAQEACEACAGAWREAQATKA